MENQEKVYSESEIIEMLATYGHLRQMKERIKHLPLNPESDKVVQDLYNKWIPMYESVVPQEIKTHFRGEIEELKIGLESALEEITKRGPIINSKKGGFRVRKPKT